MDPDQVLSVRITSAQKKQLVEFMLRHPELKSLKVTEHFNYKDAQRLWQQITTECNSLPGARKSWRQWRKTWQDMCCNAKRRKALSLGVPMSLVSLTLDDEVALSVDIPVSVSQQETPEFINLNQDVTIDDFNIEEGSVNISLSEPEPESPPERKIITRSQKIFNKISKVKNGQKDKTKHSEDCFLNCDIIAVNEQRKLDIKEDYYNFKKDYLRQKLKLMKEQTDALKTIASALSDDG